MVQKSEEMRLKREAAEAQAVAASRRRPPRASARPGAGGPSARPSARPGGGGLLSSRGGSGQTTAHEGGTKVPRVSNLAVKASRRSFIEDHYNNTAGVGVQQYTTREQMTERPGRVRGKGGAGGGDTVRTGQEESPSTSSDAAALTQRLAATLSTPIPCNCGDYASAAASLLACLSRFSECNGVLGRSK